MQVLHLAMSGVSGALHISSVFSVDEIAPGAPSFQGEFDLVEAALAGGQPCIAAEKNHFNFFINCQSLKFKSFQYIHNGIKQE